MALNLNKIKGLFIVPEDEVEGTNEKTEEKKVEVKTAEPTKFVQKEQTVNVNTITSQGEFNQNIFNSLTKAISDSNLPGEDYLEFVDALQAMKDIPLDENIKIQTVLATLSVKGLTLQKVLETAEYYIKVLDNEKQKFYEDLRLQMQNQIGKKQSELQEFEKQIRTKTEQIALLTEEITKLQQETVKIRGEASEAEVKIKNAENTFLTTFDIIVNQIKNNISKVTALKK